MAKKQNLPNKYTIKMQKHTGLDEKIVVGARMTVNHRGDLCVYRKLTDYGQEADCIACYRSGSWVAAKVLPESETASTAPTFNNYTNQHKINELEEAKRLQQLKEIPF